MQILELQAINKKAERVCMVRGQQVCMQSSIPVDGYRETEAQKRQEKTVKTACAPNKFCISTFYAICT